MDEPVHTRQAALRGCLYDGRQRVYFLNKVYFKKVHFKKFYLWCQIGLLTIAGFSIPAALADKTDLPCNRSTNAWRCTLALPQPYKTGDNLILVLEVSALQPGQSVIISQTSGQFIGQISPFGTQARRSGGTYLIPIIPEPGTNKISFQVQRSPHHGQAATPLQSHDIQHYIKHMQLRILPATSQ